MFQFEKKTGVLLIPLFLWGCGRTHSEAEDVRPTFQEGFYASESSDPKAVPLVAIVKLNRQTEAHAFLAHECNGTVRSSFRRTSIALGGSPRTLGGPHVDRLTEPCLIETEMIAESNESIRIEIKINHLPQPAYHLRKVSRPSFLQAMTELIATFPNFASEDQNCMKVLGMTCESLIKTERTQP